MGQSHAQLWVITLDQVTSSVSIRSKAHSSAQGWADATCTPTSAGILSLTTMVCKARSRKPHSTILVLCPTHETVLCELERMSCHPSSRRRHLRSNGMSRWPWKLALIAVSRSVAVLPQTTLRRMLMLSRLARLKLEAQIATTTWVYYRQPSAEKANNLWLIRRALPSPIKRECKWWIRLESAQLATCLRSRRHSKRMAQFASNAPFASLTRVRWATLWLTVLTRFQRRSGPSEGHSIALPKVSAVEAKMLLETSYKKLLAQMLYNSSVKRDSTCLKRSRRKTERFWWTLAPKYSSQSWQRTNSWSTRCQRISHLTTLSETS